jgi:hypothetical protein
MTHPHRRRQDRTTLLEQNATFVPKAEPNANPNPATIAPYSRATNPDAACARVTDDRAPPRSTRDYERPAEELRKHREIDVALPAA